MFWFWLFFLLVSAPRLRILCRVRDLVVCAWNRLDQLSLTGLAAKATDLLQKLSLDSKSKAGEGKEAKKVSAALNGALNAWWRIQTFRWHQRSSGQPRCHRITRMSACIMVLTFIIAEGLLGQSSPIGPP